MPNSDGTPSQVWASDIFDALLEYDVRQVSYVPDGGHVDLIERVRGSAKMRAIPLTTEEEGIAQCAGAWLGGARSVLLMQSSGVGNCINMLSLINVCKFPFLTLVTMRGEWGEFNPWQVPMGAAVDSCFRLMNVSVLRANMPSDVRATVQSGARMAYLGGVPVAVLLSQALVGAKEFAK